MRIHSLHFYPVKSCGPVNADRLLLETAGPLFDREWMLVDEAGKFVTQREIPELRLMKVTLSAAELALEFAGTKIAVPLERAAHQRPVQVWSDMVEAEWEGPAVDAWLEAALGRKLSLVRLGKGQRITGKENGRSVRFVDSYPLHLCSVESLAELNGRLASPVEMLRFRPNIVIEGSPAFAEDSWSGISIEGWNFPIGKACTRCSITTVDAQGIKGLEPLKTLATYRRNGTKVKFGQYLLSVAGAELRVGMEVRPV